MEELNKLIGERIRKCRTDLKMSQNELAKRINRGRRAIVSWENGTEKKCPPIEALMEMCKVFDCEIGYLVGEYDCKTHALTDVHEKTGLSEAAIFELFNHNNRLKRAESEIYASSISPEVYPQYLKYIAEHRTFLNFIDFFIFSTDYITYGIDQICSAKQNYENYPDLNFKGNTVKRYVIKADIDFDNVHTKADYLKAVASALKEAGDSKDRIQSLSEVTNEFYFQEDYGYRRIDMIKFDIYNEFMNIVEDYIKIHTNSTKKISNYLFSKENHQHA